MNKSSPTRVPPNAAASRSQLGFTLLELMICIVLIAIVFSYALNRFQDYPGEAERANFLAVSGQLRGAVNLQMMNAIASGNWQQLQALEGSNPMNLLLEPPVNYIGERQQPEETSLPRRAWYFDADAGELVYLVNDNSHLLTMEQPPQALNRIAFRLRLRYEEKAGIADAKQEISAGRSWHGLVMEAVVPYHWGSAGIDQQASSPR